MAKKTKKKSKLEEKLTRKEKLIWDKLSQKEKKDVFKFSQGYMDFIAEAKTEIERLRWRYSEERKENHRLLEIIYANQWWDISTAPEDTEVLVIGRHGSPDGCQTRPFVDIYEYGHWTQAEGDYIHLTHWMPLPQPPTQEDAS